MGSPDQQQETTLDNFKEAQTFGAGFAEMPFPSWRLHLT